MDSDRGFPKILIAAAGLLIAYVAVYILIVAANLIIPLVLAILVWYLLNTLDHLLSRIVIKGWQAPRWLRLFVALAAMILVLNFAAGIVAANVSSIRHVAPQYQKRMEEMLEHLPFGIQIEELPALSHLTEAIDIEALMQRLAREFTGLLGNIGLIAIYLIFLFLEQRHFSEKLKAAFAEDEKQRWLSRLLARIDRDVRRYIGIKTVLSFATALGSWIVMRAVGLDFAGFWALLIFVLNFIPNLGSIVATIFPSLLALIQFESYLPFFIVLCGVGALQFVIGNLLDPALMGKSLNISPLLIIFSLVFWGIIWGLPGLFLCVPITVIVIIILYNIEETRWIALLLSRDGQFKN